MKLTSLVYHFSACGLSLATLATTSMAQPRGAIYTLDNATAGNHVLAFQRAETGELASEGSFDTGGTGSGGGLSNQGAVLLSRDNRWLFVCNAGSSEISVRHGANSAKLCEIERHRRSRLTAGGKYSTGLVKSHQQLVTWTRC